jgi:methylmalonyl-CoA/ethylmalonyl-CoA epimerase
VAENSISASLPPGTLRRIDHVAIVVRDAESATARLSATLGLTIVGAEILPDIGARLCYLSTTQELGPNAVLQVVQPTGTGPVMDFLEHQGEGLHHVCFVVDDAAATLAVAEGGEGNSVFLGGRGLRCGFLSARPHGLLVELIEADPWTGT